MHQAEHVPDAPVMGLCKDKDRQLQGAKSIR